MIAINASKLAASIKTLALVRKKVSDEADVAFRQKLYYLYERAVMVSPQWSGDFASNWNIVVDGNMPVYKPWPAKEDSLVYSHETANGGVKYRMQPHQAGDYEAVQTSLGRGRSQLRGVTTKSRVHIVNATDLAVDESGTEMHGMMSIERLRPVNIIPAGTSIEAYIKSLAVAIPNMPIPEDT